MSLVEFALDALEIPHLKKVAEGYIYDGPLKSKLEFISKARGSVSIVDNTLGDFYLKEEVLNALEELTRKGVGIEIVTGEASEKVLKTLYGRKIRLFHYETPYVPAERFIIVDHRHELRDLPHYKSNEISTVYIEKNSARIPVKRAMLENMRRVAQITKVR